MTDWIRLASVIAPDMPAEQAERIAPGLDKLMAELAALSQMVPDAPAFALTFSADEGET